MAKQNIFDNEIFFEGYKKIRDNEVNANNLFEIPALRSLLPDLEGKRILDLGCGFGEHCVEFVAKGAEKVVGIDISEKMLEVAKKENSDPGITYILMPMEDIGSINEKFDVVISSLAFHYIEDFAGVVKNIHDRLEEAKAALKAASNEEPSAIEYQAPEYTEPEPQVEEEEEAPAKKKGKASKKGKKAAAKKKAKGKKR